ncbi:factor of DNA methylation 5-like [Lactuca sativa]|uniref:factor of DNA methylation 5-like n=1 Tax=Lactuca sativa TaxID=4236 RepID=UPI0022AEF56E|nr:factor of DNA methylation 5-like [Lactuca sativa]
MLEQKKSYDRLLKLAFDEKGDNEKLHNKIIELQKKIDDKELEINQLKGAMDAMKKDSTDENVEEDCFISKRSDGKKKRKGG